MIKAIAFDFDGVLVDSNQLKHDSWFAVFPESDHALVKKVLADPNIVTTRAEVFRAVFAAKGVPEENLKSRSAEFSGRYNGIVQDGIEKMGLVPGALGTLQKLSSKYSLYINSGTPEDALSETVARLDIGHFFKGVFGRRSLDTKKSEILREIMEKEKAAPEEVLMVGDADVDFEGASEVGCRFVGVANDYNGWPALPSGRQKKEFPLVKNLSELVKFL